jgi:hypothetical protein
MPRIYTNFNPQLAKDLDTRIIQPTIEDALDNISENQRYVGLTVFIQDQAKDYIWKDNISDNGLVEKHIVFNKKIIEANANALANDYIVVIFPEDNSLTEITITLPEFPTNGDQIIIHDIAYACSLDGKHIIINGNTHGICDVTISDEDQLIIDVAGLKATLTYNETLEAWDIDFGQVNIIHKDAAEGYLDPSAIDLSEYPTRAEILKYLNRKVVEAESFNISWTFTQASTAFYLAVPENVNYAYIETQYPDNLDLFKLKFEQINHTDINFEISSDKHNPTYIEELRGQVAKITCPAMTSTDEVIVFNVYFRYTTEPERANIISSTLNFIHNQETIKTILPMNIERMRIYRMYDNYNSASTLQIVKDDGTSRSITSGWVDVSDLAGQFVTFTTAGMNINSTLTVFGIYMEEVLI